MAARDDGRLWDRTPAADRPDAEVMRAQIRRRGEGQSAGPGSPETVEPQTGRPGYGVVPGLERRSDWGDIRRGDWDWRGGSEDARLDLPGALAFASWALMWVATIPVRAIHGIRSDGKD
jgi:hypothetical protein